MPSGSRPGERRGGRKRGTPNKRTVALRAGLVAAGAAPDLATPPFKFLSDVMTNESNELPVRIDAAKALLPYTNHRLGLVDSTGRDQQLNITILRFSDLEPLDRRAEKVIEHNPTEPSTSH